MDLKSSMNGQEYKEEHKPIIAMFDGDFLPFYICHNKKGQPEKTLQECIEHCNQFIATINNNVKADYYGGYLTLSGKCFRYNINPNYKANRKYDNSPKYLKLIRDYLIAEHNFKWIQEYEADDLVMSFKKNNSHYNTIIVSPDKDILSICDKAYNPKTNMFVENSKDEIEANFWKSMIIGDSADNIKGIPGMGPVAANNVIKTDGLGLYETSIEQKVFIKYIAYFGEYKGIQEFYKNYISLKILDNVVDLDIKLNKIEKGEL